MVCVEPGSSVFLLCTPRLHLFWALWLLALCPVLSSYQIRGKELRMLSLSATWLGQGATKTLGGNTVPPCDLAPRDQAHSLGVGLYFQGAPASIITLFSPQMLPTGWGRVGVCRDEGSG